MTALDYALDALSYCEADDETGETTIAGASDSKKRRLAADLTRALKRIYDLAPHLFKEPHTTLLYASQTGTIAATNGSTVVTAPTGFTMPLNGNTIQLSGDNVFNEIYQTATSPLTYRLVYPFQGTTGTVSATAWHDCIALPNAYRVHDPVMLNGYLELTPLSNAEEFNRYGGFTWSDYGIFANFQPRRRDSGQPAAYWVEERSLPSMLTRAKFLRITPMPSTSYGFRCEGTQLPPEVTPASFGTDTNDDATRTFAMPGDHEETVLRPIFLYYWSMSPYFSNPEKAQQIKEDYIEAIDILQSWVCQQNRNITFERRWG